MPEKGISALGRGSVSLSRGGCSGILGLNLACEELRSGPEERSAESVYGCSKVDVGREGEERERVSHFLGAHGWSVDVVYDEVQATRARCVGGGKEGTDAAYLCVCAGSGSAGKAGDAFHGGKHIFESGVGVEAIYNDDVPTASELLGREVVENGAL